MMILNVILCILWIILIGLEFVNWREAKRWSENARKNFEESSKQLKESQKIYLEAMKFKNN